MKLLGSIVITAALAWGQGTPEVRLKAAMHKEEVEGDLKGAIEAYRKLVAGAGANRALAATALYRLGECYRKQGNAEARKTFERLVKEYGDQAVAADARARLAATMNAGGEVRARLLWDNIADSDGKVTADGRYFSYTDWETGDLAVRDLVNGESRHVFSKGGYNVAKGEVENTAISPDGKRIVFTWYRWDKDASGGHAWELRCVDADGKNEQVLMTGQDIVYFTPGSWSPDLKWVAVQVAYEPRQSKIVLVSPDTKQVKTLLALPDQTSSDVVFSPDGRWLLFESRSPWGSLAAGGARKDVAVIAADGSEGRAAEIARDASLMGWTPDGKAALFTKEVNGTRMLYRISMNDGKPSGDPELIRSASEVGAAFLGMSKQGTLYQATWKRSTDAILLTLSGTGVSGNPKPIMPVAAYGLGGHSGGVRYSPDGKRVLYTVTPKSILVRSLVDGSEHTVTPQMARMGRVEWAADSNSMYISGATSSGAEGVYRVDAMNGAATLLFAGRSIWLMAASPDGKTLYYCRTKAPIMARDLNTGNEKRIADTPQPTFDLKLSRDGRHLAIVGYRVIRFVDLTTGRVSPIFEPENAKFESDPAFHGGTWSADGQRFYAMTEVDNHHRTELWSFPLAGGQPARQRLDKHYRSAWVTPDGTQLATVRWEQVGQIWSLENFLAAR